MHVVTAIGDFIIDLAHLDDAGIFEGTEIEGAEIFHEPTLNAFMSCISSRARVLRNERTK